MFSQVFKQASNRYQCNGAVMLVLVHEGSPKSYVRGNHNVSQGVPLTFLEGAR